MARASLIASLIGLAVWLGILGCGVGEASPGPVVPEKTRAQRTPTAHTLPPELAEILRNGPGGPAVDDGIEFGFDGDASPSLRIVLHPASAPSARSLARIR